MSFLFSLNRVSLVEQKERANFRFLPVAGGWPLAAAVVWWPSAGPAAFDEKLKTTKWVEGEGRESSRSRTETAPMRSVKRTRARDNNIWNTTWNKKIVTIFSFRNQKYVTQGSNEKLCVCEETDRESEQKMRSSENFLVERNQSLLENF